MKDKAITFTESPTFNSDLVGNTTTAGIGYWQWNEPILVETIKRESSVELIYRQTSKLDIYPMFEPDRVFKIICSCKDGKWNEERVDGVIIPKSDEHYIF